jgi:putative transposase
LVQLGSGIIADPRRRRGRAAARGRQRQTHHQNCGRREPRFSSLVAELLHDCAALYASETRPTRRHIHNLLRVAIDDLNKASPPEVGDVPVPSLAALNRRIDNLDPFATYAARFGVKKARHKFRVLTGGVDTIMPGERVEMDEHQIHLQSDMTREGYWHLLPEDDQEKLATCRLWVCAALDCATNAELGLAWGLTPSTAVALECLRQVMTDKSHIAAAVGSNSGWSMSCRPLQIVTDNGSSFTSARFRAALAGLRIRHVRTVAGEAWMRGKRERTFRTHGTSLLVNFAGQTFADVVAKGDYPAQTRVSLTGQMIVQAYVRHVLDVYHNRPHAGLGGETPADAWDRLVSEYGVSPLPGRDTVRAVFGTEVKRVVGPHGVRVFGLHYQSRDLQVWHRSTLHADRIDVRVDHHDLGRVSVRIGDGWVNAECVTPHMDGMTLAIYRETKAALAVRFAAGAKIREPHLLDAIRAAQAMAQKGLGIFGLSEPWSTPEAINRAERNLDMGWIMPGDESADTDPLDRAVPATGPEVAWPEPEPLAGTPLFRDAAEGVDDLPQVHDADEGSTKGRRAPRAAGADTSGPAPHRITWIED